MSLARPEDLDRLTPLERDLLDLLGRGHTAKTIATLKGMSEAAVNERFRSARRKTGAASTRELVRILAELAPQENRHDFIDLADTPGLAPNLRRPDRATPRRVSPFRWRLLMATAGLLAIAILAQQTSVPPAPQALRPPSPAVEQVFAELPPSPDVAALHAEIGSSVPDPAWSASTEAQLARLFQDQPGLPEAMTSLTVTCKATLCEAVGVARPDMPREETNAVMEAIQGRAVNDGTAGLKLNLVSMSFHSTRDDAGPSSMVFLGYWRRAGGS